MIAQPQPVKHYRSARRRFLQASIEQFLQTQCPKLFGSLLTERLAEKLVELVERQLPAKDHLRPGQIVWNAVSTQCRPNSPRLQLVPVILTLISPSDIEQLTQGARMSTIAKKAVARLCREAQQQGGLLSMRDIGLFTWRQNASLSNLRIAWEKQNATTLPHPGSLQDFGSCISHKTLIVEKAILEKKDPKTVAFETKHSQKAVDRYLKDFHRVRTCYQHNPNLDCICQVTGMSPYLVKQYLNLINETGP
jgi:Protein of unknown function (DUF1670)